MMQVRILEATMSHSKEDGYVGRVLFEAEGHSKAYEMTLQSKSMKDWSYALNFHLESGKEEEILAVEDRLEEDDELFDRLVDAAKDSLQR
ncbi:MAG: hypothetical protein K0R67_3379 [Paenibacillus sp.]|nr:hypothetical protein [Paenibacillus sp.]